jgi:hypothetical protein
MVVQWAAVKIATRADLGAAGVLSPNCRADRRGADGIFLLEKKFHGIPWNSFYSAEGFRGIFKASK